MPDAISALNQYNSTNACIDDDGDAGAAPAAPPPPAAPDQCLPSSSDDPGVCATPSAVPGLVARFSASSAAKLAPSASLAAMTTTFLKTSVGAVPGGGSERVAGTLIQQDATLGPLKSSLELGSASVKYGEDNDARATVARRSVVLSHGGYGLSMTADALAARANLGVHNDDGSIGGNLGSGAELVGGEVTLDTPYGSLTGGLSISASLSGSLGVRDADHDGNPEFCAKFSVPAYTLGACVEQFW